MLVLLLPRATRAARASSSRRWKVSELEGKRWQAVTSAAVLFSMTNPVQSSDSYQFSGLECATTGTSSLVMRTSIFTASKSAA